MTVPNALQRLLDGQPDRGAPMMDEELARLALLAVMLHADAQARTVTMPPTARARLRNRLLAQAALRPSPPSPPLHHDVASGGAAALSRCDRPMAGHPRPAAR
ncbi:MAG TPA: hypothetical protein VMM13_04215 [Euzebya sp.]|nr:hypothetical protein [Euzebya sp.]